jgi:hypothetical protein
LVESTFRFRGSTAPVVGVALGARPFFGRVLACRCFFPNRFLSSRCAIVVPSRHRSAIIHYREVVFDTESTIKPIMPAVFRYRGFTFFFYSNEGTPREPVHIHVEKDDLEAKFWLIPEVRVAYNDGYDARTLRELLEIVETNKDRIERAWNEFFR